jgi:hypothetical protein
MSGYLSWGLDIARLAHDREARNLSSYRPTGFIAAPSAPVGETLKVIIAIWLSCEPTVDGAFAALDRQLLRASLREAFKVTYTMSPNRAKRRFSLRVQSVLHFLKPRPVAGIDLENFLTDGNSQPDSIVEIAAKTDSPDSPVHSLQVICRSLLLLRIASGTSSCLVRTLPTSSRNDLGFWVSQVGEDRALWTPGNMPGSLYDLWKDSEEALRAVDAELPAISSYSELWP